MRCASRGAGLSYGLSPSLCNLPREPSSKTVLVLVVGDASASVAFDAVLRFLGSCVCIYDRVSRV